ncbi:hypothetical protein F2Q68_00006190 [Brassica cretica]|uniref:Uncharacterized protein n=1 Tax=Brassica cretica TaxID=69181 RepID=A0A8S9J5G0_BRACR|nr:hypothetical protein F2Q68_00006190 [Brassica cretica]
MSSSHGDKRSSDVEMGEATSPAPIPTSPVEAPACVADHLSFREKLVRRQAEKEKVRAGAELPSSSALAVAPGHGTEGITPKFTKGGDGESSQQGGSSIASGLRGKFVSLIDGMISECGSETSRLAGELLELQGRWSETEAMLTAVKGSHSVKVSKLEITIGEFERDLGKMATSLLKKKKARKAKSSEVRRLQRQIENAAGLGLSLGDDRGGMAVVQSFQSETPPTLEAKEARLSGCKGDLAVVDGDFDLILADLKSACLLPMCSEGPEGKDPVLGGDAAPGLDEATGEEGA